MRLTKAKAEMKCEHWTKRWNWSGYTKLAVRASWTQGLIAQSVKVSQWNSVVVGSNPSQADSLWLLLRIPQWWIPYVLIHSTTNVITCVRLRLKRMWRLTKAKTAMRCEHWTKRWNQSGYAKLAVRASWTHGLIA